MELKNERQQNLQSQQLPFSCTVSRISIRKVYLCYQAQKYHYNPYREDANLFSYLGRQYHRLRYNQSLSNDIL